MLCRALQEKNVLLKVNLINCLLSFSWGGGSVHFFKHRARLIRNPSRNTPAPGGRGEKRRN
jgi:hypothetical protein